MCASLLLWDNIILQAGQSLAPSEFGSVEQAAVLGVEHLLLHDSLSAAYKHFLGVLDWSWIYRLAGCAHCIGRRPLRTAQSVFSLASMSSSLTNISACHPPQGAPPGVTGGCGAAAVVDTPAAGCTSVAKIAGAGLSLKREESSTCCRSRRWLLSATAGTPDMSARRTRWIDKRAK